MSQTQKQVIFQSEEDPKREEVGVGDYYAEPQRQIIEWSAIFFQGKFYLADPKTVAQLQKVQAQIELQKQLGSQKCKVESVRDYENIGDKSQCSFATVHSPQKSKRKQIKAQKELQQEEDTNIKKLLQLKIKKQESKKKPVKNLIQVRQRNKDDFKSQKEYHLQSEKPDDNALNQSMINKIHVPKTQGKQAQQEPKTENTKRILQPIVKVEEIAPIKKETEPATGVLVSQCLKIQRKKSPIQRVGTEQSIIVKRLQVNPGSKEQDQGSILDLKSDEQSILNAQISEKQRAGSTFFLQLNDKMNTMQLGLDGIRIEDCSERKKQLQVPENILTNNLNQSQVLSQTKRILHELTAHVQQMEKKKQIQQQVQKEQRVSKLAIQNNEMAHLKKEDVALKLVQTKQVQIVQLPTFKKKKTFSMMPQIISYQIASNTGPKANQKYLNQQKQKLEKQINVLQQVIGQLRVQRLKYKINQNSNLEGESVYSAFQQTNLEHFKRDTQEPSISNKTHRPTGTAMTKFEQSVVSEFQGLKSNLVKNKSGKIVKNVSVNHIMSKIEEEESHPVGQSKQLKAGKQNLQVNENELQNRQETEEQQQIKENEDKEVIIDELEKHSPKSHKQEGSQKSNKAETHKAISHQQRQPLYKIKRGTGGTSRKISIVSEPKNNAGATIAQDQQAPLPQKGQKTQSDLESSMPRALVNRYNRSAQPKVAVENHDKHKQMHQNHVKKTLMHNFEKIQKQQSKHSRVIHEQQQVDPKRRAIRQGIIKNVKNVPSVSPAPSRQETKTSANIKQQIIEQQNNKGHQQDHKIKFGASNRNFRTRRQSNASRQSFTSHGNRSHKSVDHNIKNKEKNNMIYVPGLNQKKQNVQKNTKDEPFKGNQEQKEQKILPKAFEVVKRDICFSQIEVPLFPAAPHQNITVQQIASLVKNICLALQIEFKDNEINKLIMKKYKNCIMLDLPTEKAIKLTWHYNGKLYIGDWDQTAMMKSGEGIEYVPQKYYYKGQFLNNKKSGFGIMVTHNGTHYEGQWLEGDKHGRGKLQDTSLHLYYEGEWVSGKRDGFGYLQVESQSIYEGTFTQNYRIGYGTQKFSNGDSYKGQYVNGKFHGKGTYIWTSGSSYEGHFVDGLKQGKGQWKSQTGQTYIGEYFEDKKQGFGNYQWQNGCVYEGQFSKDRKHGKGCLRYPEGREVRGIWKEGQLVDLIPLKDQQNPLQPKKSKVCETRTVIKIHETKPNRFSTVARMSQL